MSGSTYGTSGVGFSADAARCMVNSAQESRAERLRTSAERIADQVFPSVMSGIEPEASAGNKTLRRQFGISREEIEAARILATRLQGLGYRAGVSVRELNVSWY